MKKGGGIQQVEKQKMTENKKWAKFRLKRCNSTSENCKESLAFHALVKGNMGQSTDP